MANGNYLNGKIVSILCEIRPGLASTEREIRIRIPDGVISAFVSLSSVGSDVKPDSTEKREGTVRAVVVAFSRDDVRLLFAGQDVHPSNPVPVSVDWLKKHATDGSPTGRLLP